MRTLLGLDLLTFRGGPAQDLRGVYAATANRTDYEQLVPEIKGGAAFDLIGRVKRQKPATFRDALKRIPSLPRVRVAIGVPRDPVLRYGARLLYASWRDVGLGPVLVDAGPGVKTELGRLLAAYPQTRLCSGRSSLRGSDRGSCSRRLSRRPSRPGLSAGSTIRFARSTALCRSPGPAMPGSCRRGSTDGARISSGTSTTASSRPDDRAQAAEGEAATLAFPRALVAELVDALG